MLKQEDIKIILDLDFPDRKVTDESVKFIAENPSYYRGDVKLMIAKVFTTREYSEKRNKILKYRLPR